MENLIKKIPPIILDNEIEKKIVLSLQTNADFLCVVDDKNIFLGVIFLCGLLKAQHQGNPVNYQDFLQMVTTVRIDEFMNDTLPIKEILDEFVVILNESDQYFGVVYMREVLSYKINNLSSILNVQELALQSLHCTVNVVNNNLEIIHSSISEPRETRRNIASLTAHINNAQQNSILSKEIEFLNDNKKYMANIMPIASCKGPSNTLVAIQDTGNLKHFVILETVFDSMREGINIVDENGYLQYINPSSARYVNATSEEMLGQHITKFYPDAVLLKVLANRQAYDDERLLFKNRVFVVNAVPFYVENIFKGGIAIFREVTEIIQLTQRIASMEQHINSMEFELNLSRHYDIFDSLVGCHGSLQITIHKAQRCIASLGGPRHCIITGETGTGKSVFAKTIYQFAKRIKVLRNDAPFIDVNCGQFTNPDIAAIEIFGSEKGSFTGAIDKQGLLELADEGIIFLDEAHALGPHQTMLLKIIEEGVLRRVGGRTGKKLNVIIIAASTKDLQKELMPELYQRLAKYTLHLEPLRNRPNEEKQAMLQVFLKQYEESAKKFYGINLKLSVTPSATDMLISSNYPRNIRQFRDAVNASVDAAAPPIFNVVDQSTPLNVVVDNQHIPQDIVVNISCPPTSTYKISSPQKHFSSNQYIDKKIVALRTQGYGPRKIANILRSEGINVEYYHITYRLTKLNLDH